MQKRTIYAIIVLRGDYMFENIKPINVNGVYLCGGRSENPHNTDFPLHMHSEDEIYIFLDGSVDYSVEGTSYKNLQPFDIILIKNSKYHCIKHHTPVKPYNRLILSIPPVFYKQNKISPLTDIFGEKYRTSDCIIPANVVKSGEIYKCLEKYNSYFTSSPNLSEFLSKGLVCELVYLISRLDMREKGVENPIIRKIIDKINRNISGNVTLNSLASDFYISTRHLSRIFKEETGMTVKKYITLKRLNDTRKYLLNGMNITDACIEAGFSCYNNFYRAFVNEYNTTPKNILTNNFFLKHTHPEP